MFCVFLLQLNFSDGGEEIAVVRPINRPGWNTLFLSSSVKNRAVHATTGNGDSEWSPVPARVRSHQKKNARGRRKSDVGRCTVSSRTVMSPVIKRRRVFVNNEVKLRAVDEYESLLSICASQSVAKESFKLVYPRIDYAAMLRWKSNVSQLREDVSNSRYRKLHVSSNSVSVRKEAWFPEAEKIVFAKFEDEREEGMKVSTLWFTKL